MALTKLYDRINWSDNTAPDINASNLNRMSKGLDDLDDRVIDIADTLMATVPEIIALYDSIEELSQNPPKISPTTGNWLVWDTETGAYVDSGIDASITVSIGTTQTLPAGSDATVNNSGTPTDPVFNFGIPKGDKGDTGNTGATPNISATATVDANVGTPAVEVTKSGTAENPSLAFAFSNLKGEQGETGQTGATGQDGVSPAVSISTISGGHRVTITDKDHPSGQNFDVMDGQTQDISGKADKVSSAINGNFAGLDSSGNLTDSGHKHSDYITSHQTIKQDGATGATVNRYAKCLVPANAATKQIDITSGTLSAPPEVGTKIHVYFPLKNTADNPKIQIGSGGAYSIVHRGSYITTGENKGLLYGAVDFVFEGNAWLLCGNYEDVVLPIDPTSTMISKYSVGAMWIVTS